MKSDAKKLVLELEKAGIRYRVRVPNAETIKIIIGEQVTVEYSDAAQTKKSVRGQIQLKLKDIIEDI